MSKKILITGATDGIGLETAKKLVEQGHQVVIHGRNKDKLAQVEQELLQLTPNARIETLVCDLSSLKDVATFADHIRQHLDHLDVLINNAGVFKAADSKTSEGLDIRFAVNTYAPFILTNQLASLLGQQGRVVNLSSAAQDSVNLAALVGEKPLSDQQAYAQSKLAITMWSRMMGNARAERGPVLIAVNPASLLGSKMVKTAYGISGGDLSIGADILCRAALSDEFADQTGLYFDNDIGQFAAPHPDAQDDAICQKVIQTMEQKLEQLL